LAVLHVAAILATAPASWVEESILDKAEVKLLSPPTQLACQHPKGSKNIYKKWQGTIITIEEFKLEFWTSMFILH